MQNELDIVRDVSQRLDGAGIGYMLTGSMAMNYYAQPRMTRDIDVVVALQREDGERVVMLFSPDYYVSREAVDSSIAHQSQTERVSSQRIQPPPAHQDSRLLDVDRKQGRPDSLQAFLGEGFALRDATTRREESGFHRL